MGLLTKSYTFANGVGNNVDATQVNKDFDDLYTLVNGNIEAVNMKDRIITLAKLASEIKVIESVTHTPLASNYTLTNGETTIFSQDITLSAQRYCLILLSYMARAYNSATGTTGVACNIYDGSNIIGYSLSYVNITGYAQIQTTKCVFKQLTSKAHTIYVKGYYSGTSGIVFGDADGLHTTLTTIVFAF